MHFSSCQFQDQCYRCKFGCRAEIVTLLWICDLCVMKLFSATSTAKSCPTAWHFLVARLFGNQHGACLKCMQVGIEMKFKDMKYPVIIAPTHVPELNAINITSTGVEVGAAVTLTRLMHTLKGLIAELPAYQTSTFKAVINQLRSVWALHTACSHTGWRFS
jgi:hypothetical protein